MNRVQSVPAIIAVAAGFAIASLAPARAADVAPQAAPQRATVFTPVPSSEWTVTIGAEARYLPKFEGADDMVVRALPIFRVSRAGKESRFRAPRDGASFAIFDTEEFKLGPTFKLRQSRNESDDAVNLRGLGDVNWAFEVGAFAEYWPTEWLRTRFEVRQGFGGHHGVVADAMADVVFRVTPQLTLSGGPRLTAGTASSVSPYFSVTPGQAVLSGLPVYDARGGLRSYGAGAQARYAWTPQWATHVFVEYERLTGDVGNSPLVSLRGSRDQVQVGMGVTYSFNVPGLW
ncbi:MAG: MipA/OmpV family protein [Pseudolabrys sp.]|nr:MipA/OmpV family protein [Pseudolabrys sp.]MDP2295150.1 MipA/OmpV family protein [Pseudolabrys sp.]